jgi:hypothetical protein
MTELMNYQKPRTNKEPMENIMIYAAWAALVLGSLALILGAWIYEI